MVHRKRGLDQAGDSGSGLEVADVGLDGSDEGSLPEAGSRAQLTRPTPVIGVQDLAQGSGLDGITYSSSGAMCLHVSDLSGGHARLPDRGQEVDPLRILAGHGDPRS